MKEFSNFETFNILGDTVNILFVDSDYGTNVISEINQKHYYYMGLLNDLKETNRFKYMDQISNIHYAMIAWEGFFNRQIDNDSYSKIVNASIENNPPT